MRLRSTFLKAPNLKTPKPPAHMTIQTASQPAGQPVNPLADSAADRSQLWMAAIKPPMYCVAIMPICVGSVVAFVQTGIFYWGIFVTFAFSAVLLLVWENLSNDVFDATTGIDKNKHHSLVNLTRNRPFDLLAQQFGLGFGRCGYRGDRAMAKGCDSTGDGAGLLPVGLLVSRTAFSARLPRAGRNSMLFQLWAIGGWPLPTMLRPKSGRSLPGAG